MKNKGDYEYDSDADEWLINMGDNVFYSTKNQDAVVILHEILKKKVPEEDIR